MKKLLYKWAWSLLYCRAIELEKAYVKRKDCVMKAHYLIKLQNLLQYLKEELIEGEKKCVK